MTRPEWQRPEDQRPDDAEAGADEMSSPPPPGPPLSPEGKQPEPAAPAPEATQAEDAAAKAKPPVTPAEPAAPRPARAAKEGANAPSREMPPPGSINELLAAAVPDVPLTAYLAPDMTGKSVAVEVPRDSLPQVMTAARDNERLKLDYLRCLSGVDWQEQGLEVVYHLWSMSKHHALTVKTRCSVDDPVVPSIASIYPAADWHERETRDMFGIVFEGHPNLVPLLLPEDMTDHFPLRKENPLQEIEEWQGVNLVEGAEGDEGGEE